MHTTIIFSFFLTNRSCNLCEFPEEVNTALRKWFWAQHPQWAELLPCSTELGA